MLQTINATLIEINIFDSQDTQTFLYNGDLQHFPGVDQLPHLGVSYPLTNGKQQLRHASGRCLGHHQSVISILQSMQQH